MRRLRLPRSLVRRATLRIRLTVLYTLLLLTSGGLLLAVTYGLVRHNISTTKASTHSAPLKADPVQLTLCKRIEAVTTVKGSASAKVSRASAAQLDNCKALFASEATAGADAQRASTLHHLLLYWLLALAILSVLSTAVGWWLAGRALRPIERITNAASQAAAGDLTQRLALDGPRDEVHKLAATFDQMLDRLHAAFTRQQQFIANASHELRTPLSIMRTSIEVTLAKPTRHANDIELMTVDLQRAIGRSEELVDALLALARSEQTVGRQGPGDLATIAEDALDDAAPTIRERQIHVERDLQPAPVHGDAVLLERLIANLLSNAIRHNDGRGEIQLATATGAGSSHLTVENTGPVIRPEQVAPLLEPFQRLHDRTQNDGGLGLGLPIACAIARSHGGTLEANARPEGGLKIDVRLPRPPSAQSDSFGRSPE